MRFWYWLPLFVVTLGTVTPSFARPLLKDSQQTHAGTCLDANEPPERLIEICEAGLADFGATDAQRQGMLLELADALYETDENERAQEIVDGILAEEPSNARALTISGWIDWDADEYEEASQHFEAAIAIAPTAESMGGLASAGRRGDLIDQDRFVLLMDTALAMSPVYIWAHREKGWGMMAYGLPGEAEDAFRAGLDVDPDNVWTLYGLGYVLNKMDRHDEALEYLNHAIAEGGDAPEIYSQRSMAAHYVGRYKLALQDADQVLAARPDSAEGRVRRARALSEMGQRETAIKELTTRHAQEYDGFVAYALAELLYDDGETDAALKVLSTTFDQGNPDYYDHEFYALLLTELKRYDAADEAIDAALALRENADFPLYYRALILIDKGAFDAAEKSMSQALENGLPDHRIKEFLAALTRKGAYVRVIRWRLKYDEAE